jgi:O-antigen/teichoic acid export membrane protein
MRVFRLSAIKNAIANLVRGGATAAVAIALPRFLTRSLDTEHFAAWSLILQVAGYATYLDFGLQTAIARFVAQAIELEQEERQAKLVSTAMALLSLAGLIAFAGISIGISQLTHLFSGIPLSALSDFRHAALLLSLTACLLLPLSTYTGVLIGMQRNEIAALAIGGSRIAGAGAAVVTGHYTQSLTVLALCIGAPNLLGGLLQMAAVQGMMAGGRVRVRNISRSMGAEMIRFCAGLTVWSLSMLVIGGLDLTIVGHFRFSAVGFYSVAAMLITFFTGLTNATLGAMMAPLAALHARGEDNRILTIVLTATRMTMLGNLLLTAAIFLFGGPLLRLWVGTIYAEGALPILKVLSFAQALRLMLAPYSVMLISTGEQAKAIPSAICEALVNLVASIAGVMVFGPVGVAWGTLAGAVCGLLWTFLRIMPSVRTIRLSLGKFMLRAVLPGSLPCVPLAVFWLIQGHLTSLQYGIGLSTCLAASTLLGSWRSGFFRSFSALRGHV